MNCVQPHPFEPMIASSGIDYNVKLWAPISNEVSFDEAAAKTVRYNNILFSIIMIILNYAHTQLTSIISLKFVSLSS